MSNRIFYENLDFLSENTIREYQDELRSIYDRINSKENISDWWTVMRFFHLFNTLTGQREPMSESSCSSCVRRMMLELDGYFSALDQKKTKNEKTKKGKKPSSGQVE